MHEALKKQVIFDRVNITNIECIDNQTIYGATPCLTSYFSIFRPSNYIPNHQEVAAISELLNSIKLLLKTIPY
ncbi:hypothetical protein ES703_70275 [subsurface metagenome]